MEIKENNFLFIIYLIITLVLMKQMETNNGSWKEDTMNKLKYLDISKQ